MKRMIIALLLLGVIIGSAFITACLVENAIDKTCVALNECTRKEKNEKLDSLKIGEAISVWNRNKKILYAIMFHEDFSGIEKSMVKLEYLSHHSDFLRSSCLCAETELLLRNKKEEIKVSFENVF